MIESLITLLILISCLILFSGNIVNIVVLNGIFSLLVVGFYVANSAVDVALTEIIISCGVFGIFSLLTLSIVGCEDNTKSYFNFWYIFVATLFFLLIVFFILGINDFGGAFGPSYSGVSRYYLFNSMKDIHVENVVTSILASYRGYDTMGETMVIFTSGVGLYAIFRDLFDSEKKYESVYNNSYPVVTNTIILIFPLMVLYSLIIQFHGDYRAGGGFQAGAIFATAIVCYNLITECSSINFCYIRRSAFCMSIGIISYIFVGLLCMFFGGEFLNYSFLHSIDHIGQHLGIFFVELGIGITVASSIITLSSLMLLFYNNAPFKHCLVSQHMGIDTKDISSKRIYKKIRKNSQEEKEVN